MPANAEAVAGLTAVYPVPGVGTDRPPAKEK